MAMYRDYENPYTLEKELKAAKEERQALIDSVADVDEILDRLISLDETINDLEERVNFAWSDEEWG